MSGEDTARDILWKSLKNLEAHRKRFYADPNDVPTIGIGYAGVVKGSDGKWVVRDGIEEDIKAIGAELKPEHLAALKMVADELSKDKKDRDETALKKAADDLGSVSIESEQGRALFDRVYEGYRKTTVDAVGEENFNALTPAQQAALMEGAYQSPDTLTKAGPDLAKHIGIQDWESLGERFRKIGEDLKDESRYQGGAAVLANPNLNGMIRVNQGDTLEKLAGRYQTTVGAMMEANPHLTDPDKVRAGGVLTLPPGARDIAEIIQPAPHKPQPPEERGTAGPDANGAGPDASGPPSDGKAERDSWNGGAETESLGAEARGLLGDIERPGAPYEDAMLRPVDQWDGQDIHHVMKARIAMPAGDPARDDMFARERDYFRHAYGDSPARTDATGRLVDSEAPTSRPVADDAARGIWTNAFAKGLRRVGLDIARAANRDGVPNAVRDLQRGLNLMADTNTGEGGRASLLALRVDGAFGPKTRTALRRAVAGQGAGKAREGIALGRFLGGLEAARGRVSDDGTMVVDTDGIFGPLFGRKTRVEPVPLVPYRSANPPVAMPKGEPRPEAEALQETLNDFGPRLMEGGRWTPLKEDGVIGPKTTRAFNALARIADPAAFATRFGKLLGFL